MHLNGNVYRDNSATDHKVAVRRWIGDRLPGAAVLDCYAGQQHMRRLCWAGRRWLGIDSRSFRLGAQIKGDNRKVVAAMPLAQLQGFALFDLDSYGEPFEVLATICRRLAAPGLRLGFALTMSARCWLVYGEGIVRQAWPADLPYLACEPWCELAQDVMIDRALAGARILGRCRATAGGALMRYEAIEVQWP